LPNTDLGFNADTDADADDDDDEDGNCEEDDEADESAGGGTESKPPAGDDMPKWELPGLTNELSEARSGVIKPPYVGSATRTEGDEAMNEAVVECEADEEMDVMEESDEPDKRVVVGQDVGNRCGVVSAEKPKIKCQNLELQVNLKSSKQQIVLQNQ
jgi:hypothetical protein